MKKDTVPYVSWLLSVLVTFMYVTTGVLLSYKNNSVLFSRIFGCIYLGFAFINGELYSIYKQKQEEEK